MSTLDKEGGEVQKTANHTVLAVGGGGGTKVLLAVQNASCAHRKALAILACYYNLLHCSPTGRS